MRITKVLLVDDEEDIRTIGAISLRRIGGWQTVLAGDGPEALEVARRERPDVILLDVMMPELDGPDVLRRLRADPETCAIPVIFLTAKVQPGELGDYLELGAAGAIAKPFDPLTLADDVGRIVADLPPLEVV